MKIFSAIKDAPKKLLGMVFSGARSMRSFFQPLSRVNFEAMVGDGTGSSTVMAPLLWIARTFPEAPIGLWRSGVEGQEEQVRDSEFLRLMRRPNPHYSGSVLMTATIIDRTIDGDAYWIKVRDIRDRVREYWWAPTATMTPKGDEENFITHYEYKPGNEIIYLRPQDVVHFRFGLDAGNPRKGMSPLKSVLREVFTDDEAANFTASLLRNSGVPGLMVSPEVGAGKPSEEDVKATKAYIREKFTGDNRGEALIMSGPTKVQQFGFSPEQLLLKDLRRIPEERVTAILGVPAIVSGLGAGLDRATFTNYTEGRQAAYEQAIIPSQTQMAEDIWSQVLPDFVGEDEIWLLRVGFDYSRVRVLQEDQNKLANRMAVEVRAGIAKRSEARRALGHKAGPEDEVYIVPLNTALVPADGSEPRVFTAPKGSENP